MNRWKLSLVAVLAAAAAAVGAADTKDNPNEPPAAPAGWKYIVAKDKSYQFLVPTATKSTSSRESTFKRAGLSGKVQRHQVTTKDGTTYVSEATSLSGAALKGMKIGEMYTLMIDAEKEKGGDVSEPKEFVLGKRKGKEFTIDRGKSVVRVVLLVVRGRSYQLSVTSANRETVTGDKADTFLKSLFIVPKEASDKEKDKDK